MTQNSTPAAAAALAAIRTTRTAPAPQRPTQQRRAYNPNPWLELALERVRLYERGAEKVYEVRATLSEYAEHTSSRPCRCGGRLWYRVTVGAYQCPRCRALQTWGGEYLKD